MDSAGHELLRGRVAEWFPLLPRPRPPCRALPRRIDEIRELARSASEGANETRMSSDAEAHNKAALLLSDCGLANLAQQLCWRQFDIFHAATPLTAKTAIFALQPIVNLGRLLTRSGQSARAYQIFQNAYDAVGTQAATMIGGRHIDFSQLVNNIEQRQETRRFLWTVLLADGTRALTRTGRWSEALKHIERHKGIGKRMLDGRQVAILARCTAGDCDGAIAMLDDSCTPDPWEEAVTACLRTLCLSVSDRPTDSSVAAMVNHYLQLDPTPGYPVFRTRLGLCVLDLAGGLGGSGVPEVAGRIAREAVTSSDAYYNYSARMSAPGERFQNLATRIVRRVWRFVLGRRWWVGHVLVLACCLVFVRLGRWQWDRAQSPTGDWQNLGYALQWPLFAVVLAAAWIRFLWLERRRGAEPGPPAALTPPVPRRPAQPPIRPPTREDDPDDELAAYNAYLARLAEQDQR